MVNDFQFGCNATSIGEEGIFRGVGQFNPSKENADESDVSDVNIGTLDEAVTSSTSGGNYVPRVASYLLLAGGSMATIVGL